MASHRLETRWKLAESLADLGLGRPEIDDDWATGMKVGKARDQIENSAYGGSQDDKVGIWKDLCGICRNAIDNPFPYGEFSCERIRFNCE
jgi:hypothetical protein